MVQLNQPAPITDLVIGDLGNLNIGPKGDQVWQILAVKIHLVYNTDVTGSRSVAVIGQNSVYGNYLGLFGAVGVDVSTAVSGTGTVDGIGTSSGIDPLQAGISSNLLGNGDGNASDAAQYGPLLVLKNAYLIPGSRFTDLGSLASGDSYDFRYIYLEWGLQEWLDKLRP